MNERIIGIMGAMNEEISSIMELLSNVKIVYFGMRTYYSGTINDIPVVVVFSRWGKVAAATTVTSLITRFNITDLVFIGVAGAIQPHLRIGDVVVATRLIQHDMDARPLINRHEIPLLNVTYLESNPRHLKIAKEAVQQVITNQLLSFIPADHIERFGLNSTCLYSGDIASGDRFFANKSDKDALLSLLPHILCVEMEGAAVAQVCYEYAIPFVVLRIISDESNEQSAIDFSDFITSVSSRYAKEIINQMFLLITKTLNQ